MGQYWRLIGHYQGEATTYEALAGSLQSSPYTPDEDAHLIGIRCIVAPEAATSLVENYQIRLTCTTFKPNTIHVGGCGNGLATAPAFPAPITDWTVNQPVKSGVPITIEGRHAVATAVTCNVMIFGLFSS
jgi:hypothetical protein